jgi:hypothetical protein
MSAQGRSHEAAHAVGADGQAGIVEREPALSQVERQKRQDERAELVQKRAQKQNPGRTRQRPQTRQQGWLFDVHGKKKPAGLSASRLEKSLMGSR